MTHPTVPHDDKAFRTLQASFARAGHELLKLPNGTLLAAKWGCTRTLDSLTDAQQWLERVEGTRCGAQA